MRARQIVAPRSKSAWAQAPSKSSPGALLDALHVRVDGQDVAAEREVADRSRGVRADAGQLGQVVRPPVGRDVLRGAVQADRAPVVAEALPLDDHVRGRRGCERLDGRPALEPGPPARDHAVDLRLLQHDLAHQDRVGIRRLAPREIAPVLAVPGQEQLPHARERSESGSRHRPKDRTVVPRRPGCGRQSRRQAAGNR